MIQLVKGTKDITAQSEGLAGNRRENETHLRNLRHW